MEQPSKLFTLDEANQALGQVRFLVERLQRLQASLLAIENTPGNGNGNGHGNGHAEFEATLQKLDTLGGVLKDLEQGLVDFYSLRDGDLVFLCWKLGEPSVGFWHALDTGFASRQPV